MEASSEHPTTTGPENHESVNVEVDTSIIAETVTEATTVDVGP